MGCWAMFRGSLTIEPPITEKDKKEFEVFAEENSFPTNPRARYAMCWAINEEGRLYCYGDKFGTYELWLKYLYDKFFEPRGYDIHGSLLNAWDARQTEWKLLRVDNGVFFQPRHDPIYVDLDFWEESAEYTRQKWEERKELLDPPPRIIYDMKPEQYGGLFDPYEEPIDVDGDYSD